MSFPPDLVEMLAAFDAHRVRFLVVGGHAVSLHARPRTTKDLDIWLDEDRENISRVCDALAAFGVPEFLVEELRQAAPDEIVWIGKVPARIDFLQRLPGVVFDEAWTRRVTISVEGVEVPVIGRDDLIANKRATGRPQDLRDVRALSRASGPTERRPAKRAAKKSKK